ncbi:hypothetical protein COCOBI_03-0320 [Coccomyxa sp. Obi]|nr:hypothetical protein COCOBI_03-0320 [Coccomyxa sp. Obi]
MVSTGPAGGREQDMQSVGGRDLPGCARGRGPAVALSAVHLAVLQPVATAAAAGRATGGRAPQSLRHLRPGQASRGVQAGEGGNVRGRPGGKLQGVHSCPAR